MLTCGCRPTTYVVIFVIELDSHPFAVASRHSTAAAPAQWDRDNSVDVSKHDGDTDSYKTKFRHTFTQWKFYWASNIWHIPVQTLLCEVNEWHVTNGALMQCFTWDVGKQNVKERKWKGRHLTNSYCCNHRRHNHRQRHTTSYYQIPLVFRDVLALIAIMDLRRKIIVNNSTSSVPLWFLFFNKR